VKARRVAPRDVLKRTWALETDGGRCQPIDYLEGVPVECRQKMNSLLRYVDINGYHPRDTKYKVIEPGIVEFKVKVPRAIRVLAYKSSKGHVLIHGFDKGEGKIPAAVLTLVRKRIAEFEAGGADYE